MADKPILFSAPMVKALLSGTKTQTRRKLDAWTEEPVAYIEAGTITALDENESEYRWPRTHAVGDRLYVREAWRTWAQYDDVSPRGLVSGTHVAYEATESPNLGNNVGRFRQGMHMPRWASRLTLTVTDVRVERLQDISEADALAEGVERLHHGFYPYGIATFMTTFVDGKEVPAQCCTSAHDSYMLLWDSINGRNAWQANPWVAAYTFTVHHGNIDQMGGE